MWPLSQTRTLEPTHLNKYSLVQSHGLTIRMRRQLSISLASFRVTKPQTIGSSTRSMTTRLKAHILSTAITISSGQMSMAPRFFKSDFRSQFKWSASADSRLWHRLSLKTSFSMWAITLWMRLMTLMDHLMKQAEYSDFCKARLHLIGLVVLPVGGVAEAAPVVPSIRNTSSYLLTTITILQAVR